MADIQSTQICPKFQYRFMALSRADMTAKPCRLSVEAETERDARRVLAPLFILAFAARLPVGLVETTIPCTLGDTVTDAIPAPLPEAGECYTQNDGGKTVIIKEQTGDRVVFSYDPYPQASHNYPLDGFIRSFTRLGVRNV